MRKLRLMEKSQGIWTMECQLMVDNNYLIVYDKKNGVRSLNVLLIFNFNFSIILI